MSFDSMRYITLFHEGNDHQSISFHTTKQISNTHIFTQIPHIRTFS